MDKTAVSTTYGFDARLANTIQANHKQIEAILSADYSDVAIPRYTSQDLSELVKDDRGDKLLIIHLTSEQASCSSCVKNNSLVRLAVKQYGNEFEFAELIYNPVKAFRKDGLLKKYLKKNKMRIRNLPAILFYEKGKSKGRRLGIWPTIINDLQQFKNRKG